MRNTTATADGGFFLNLPFFRSHSLHLRFFVFCNGSDQHVGVLEVMDLTITLGLPTSIAASGTQHAF
ncbi:hypothetical protein L2E82_07919 [Cichorium intybus]|uniref:Uncharacterized protein n=2 Tax=Cichorium intybus TaxID=13427 RepID=A0ACB9G5R9_CICIN|nr:hypothetical protein L2E82_29996 [Cichorium intybus]KAI3778543.1 hypothetical protein L2E82_07919 [Cichorium intybus]